MSSTLKRFRLTAVLGTLALGLLISAPAASASDTFFLKNDSKVAQLEGTSLWGKGNSMPDECRTGPFPAPSETLFVFNPGVSGSITLTQDPFSACPDFINPLIDNSIDSPGLTSGTWIWIPDDPVIGDASLTCSLQGQSGSRQLWSSVDGLTCTIYDGVGQQAGLFGSSAAPLRGGEAVAYVQHYPEQGATGSSSGSYELVLRDRKGGRVHGREMVNLASGKPRKVRVPISEALRKQVAKKDSVQVKATLRRVDGMPGSGDRTVLRVMKDHSSLPF